MEHLYLLRLAALLLVLAAARAQNVGIGTTRPDGYKAVNYAQFTPALLEVIKDLTTQNAAREARLAIRQQAHHAALQQQLARLRAAHAQR